MSGDTPISAPWLIAAWPGMGNVAIIAAGFLVQHMGLAESGTLPPGAHFDVGEIQIKNGIVQPVHIPRGIYFRAPHVAGHREIIVFLGEAQPAAGIYSYAQEFIAEARRLGVGRVITFASIASAMHPAAPSKVAGIATSQMLLSEMTRAEVRAMSDGQIGGLNGLVLAAAADQGIDGMCLLAEIPYFAAQVPSPKAARAALSVFSVLAGIDVRLEALDRHAEQYDRMLTEAYEQMKAHEGRGQQADDSAPEKESASQQAEGEDAGSGEGSRTAPPALSDEARARIEGLFEEARRDSSRAVALKQELDRLGVFRQFENRFLDLFRRAG